MQVCSLIAGYHIRKHPDKAFQLIFGVMKIEGKFFAKLLFESWDFFSDTWVLVTDVVSNELVKDLVVVWLVCTSHARPLPACSWLKQAN